MSESACTAPRTPCCALPLLAFLATAPASASETPVLTPQQLIEEVRADQWEPAALPPTVLAPVPTVEEIPPPPLPHPHRHHTPTLKDREQLVKQLKDVDSALKIREVTDRNLQHPVDAITAHGKMLYPYTDGGFYEIQTATFHETALELQPGESLTGQGLPTAGDTTRWTIALTRTGAAPKESIVLLVKPLDTDLETNMTIATDRRLYTLILKSNEKTYMPLVAWLYPQDDARAQAEQELTRKKTEASVESVRVPPEDLNFNCAITGKRVAWKPVRAYDDGAKTYLQMNPKMTSDEAPAFFVMDGKTPLLVNYRVKQTLYVVDRLFDRAQLRIGNKSWVDIKCIHQLALR